MDQPHQPRGRRRIAQRFEIGFSAGQQILVRFGWRQVFGPIPA
jgi:hypothetical protein